MISNNTEFFCPICNVPLVSMLGHKMHPNDPNYGITLYCANIKCSAQEVFAGGKNEEDAYEVIKVKYIRLEK